MQVTTAWWAGTLTLIGLLLIIDLARSGRNDQLNTRQNARWLAFYVVLTLAFALLISSAFGMSYGGQFIAGWLTEYSLSVDNLFVFLILMTRFAVPQYLQLRVLTVGVMIALLLRGVLIGVGAVALQEFSWLFYLFGAFLLWTAWATIRSDHHRDAGEAPAPPTAPGSIRETRMLRLLSRLLPNTPVWHGSRLVIRGSRGWLVTPMLLTMVAIGVTDVLFALDSIPAIFGLTTEPFLVVCANAFALVGLRRLFFVVRGLLNELEHLNRGLAFVLAFIGVKLVLGALHANTLGFINNGQPVSWAPKLSTAVSLGVVALIILTTVATSLFAVRGRRRARVEPLVESLAELDKEHAATVAERR